MPPVASFGQTHSPRGVSFATIVLAIRDRLGSLSGINDSKVIVVADRKVNPRALAETHLRVRPLRRNGLGDPGGGRLADFKTRLVAIDIICRDARDQPSSDLIALTDATTGQLVLEEAVLDALDLHTPRSTANVPYTVDPLREVSTDDPNRPNPGDGFTADTIYFEARYIPRYTLERT